MLILLPPSEGKAPDGTATPFPKAHPELRADTQSVLKHIERLAGAERIKFYALKTKEKAAAAHTLNRTALDAHTLPALERYTGVVYQNIEVPTLKKKRNAEKRIFVVSGYFGLISGGTRIPNYKMPINTWLARQWKPVNTERLQHASGRKKVLSLLPQAYAKAVELDNAITVDFRVAGGKKAAGHFGKAIKGRFVRFLLENNITNQKDFSDFQEEGYRFDGTNFVQD
jgi:cytoplasmic iron level regulating protein YaaA (DUF328/UPF0246 family)